MPFPDVDLTVDVRGREATRLALDIGRRIDDSLPVNDPEVIMEGQRRQSATAISDGNQRQYSVADGGLSEQSRRPAADADPGRCP